MKTLLRSLFAAVALAATFVLTVQAAAPFIYPRIKGHGKVVALPDAAEQPRAGSKICVDVTVGGESEAVNPGLEKVARFVNIYAGAGKQPARCDITVVLHGSATSAALSDAAYAKHLAVKKNPNLPLIRQLHAAKVEFIVCGQALASKGYAQNDADKVVTVAVSALTANVNRQADGYAFIPLH